MVKSPWQLDICTYMYTNKNLFCRNNNAYIGVLKGLKLKA